jgi:N-acetylglucosamine kinase-like BadF-type ATPase
MIYKIGVDGGASKTECILVDEWGAVVSRHVAAGCNPSVVGAEAARRTVADALAALRKKMAPENPNARIAVALLCMAGPREFWREFAAGLSDFGRGFAADDSLPVLELATGGGPGLVLHAGTGSFVAARTHPGLAAGTHYAGGLGWRFGDAGSGYDIGRRAIARGLLELQGWAAPSGLGALLRGHTGLGDAGAITRHFYSAPFPNPLIAGLAPAVLDLAADGDGAAFAIVLDSTGELLDLAMHVAQKLFPDAPPGGLRAGLSGPILNHPAVFPALTRRCSLALQAVDGAPVEGVRRLLQRIGAQANEPG